MYRQQPLKIILTFFISIEVAITAMFAQWQAFNVIASLWFIDMRADAKVKSGDSMNYHSVSSGVMCLDAIAAAANNGGWLYANSKCVFRKKDAF